MIIRELSLTEEPPMDLLLLADPSEELVEEYLEMGECYVAEKDGQVIGVYVLLAKKPGVVELANVAVKEELQGKGIGTQLVLEAIRVARESGYRTIEVGTGNSSIGQLALYKKCGFEEKEVWKDFFVKNYSEPIFENGVQCKDMVRLSQNL